MAEITKKQVETTYALTLTEREAIALRAALGMICDKSIDRHLFNLYNVLNDGGVPSNNRYSFREGTPAFTEREW